MSKWSASWSGNFPNFCRGEWRLYRDDVLVADAKTIPFGHGPANTFGTYRQWTFDEDWSEVWYEYEEGLTMDSWIDLYAEWLRGIAAPEEWCRIYEAFRKEDWRSGCCGGCI